VVPRCLNDRVAVLYLNAFGVVHCPSLSSSQSLELASGQFMPSWR
jgi:hypothetical protein